MKSINLFFKLNRKFYQPSGFSLVEILIALTLIGIAGTFVAGKIFEQLEEGQVKSARIQMGNFKGVLSDFRRKCGFYPTTEQGLEALLQKPEDGKECKNYPAEGFISDGNLPKDPWDEEYIYELTGKTRYRIISYGPDRESDTEDDIYYPDKKE